VIEAATVYFSLILARVGTFVAVMPLFADRAPRVVRAGLAMALAVFYFSAVMPRWDASLAHSPSASGWPFFLALGREALIGAAMGFAFSLFLLPAQVAGAFVANQIGLATGPQTGPSGHTAPGAIAVAFEVLASVIFLELNAHHVLLSALHASFAKLPVGGTLVPQPLTPMVDGLARAHEVGVLLASPMALSLLLLTVMLAFMSRVAPQLNIQTVGFTLQSIVALVGAAFLLPDFVQLMVRHTGQVGATIQRFLE
jgi:flagellar biosynthetic protein FliR